MVVVPALAERDQREEPVVAALVPGAVALLAEHVRERVDGVRAVIAGDGGDEEAPHEHLPAGGAELGLRVLQIHADEEDRDREHHRHEDVEAIEQAQLGKLHQVPNALQVRREALLRQEPAHVRADEAVLHGE